MGIVQIREEMIKAGELAIKKVPLRNGKAQHRPVPRRNARTQVFAPEQLQLVDKVIEMFSSSTAEGVSDFSHLELGWQAARMHERIPAMGPSSCRTNH